MNIQKELKNLNDLSAGIHKQWIYGNKTNYMLCCDYLQKIGISIMDFNYIVNQELSREKLCYLILLVVWIKDSCMEIEDMILPSISDAFKAKEGITYKTHSPYSEEINKCNSYMNALRSFVIAHPLTTDRHKKYGLDGNYICLDISFPQKEKLLKTLSITEENTYEFNRDGLMKNSKPFADYDYCLFVCSKKNGAEFFQYFVCNIEDLIASATVYIERIYRLSKFLSKYRKSMI